MRISDFNKIQIIKNSDAVQNLLSRLNPGDVVRAQVLEMQSNELLLKLYDGTVFSAVSSVRIDAKPGELLDFVVSAKNENQILLETVKKDNYNTEMAVKQLKEELILNDLKPTSKNIKIALELKQNGIDINKDMVENVLRHFDDFKGISIEKSVFLALNGIKSDERNIQMLNDLIGGRLNLTNNLNELTGLLSQMDSEESEVVAAKDFIKHAEDTYRTLEKQTALIKDYLEKNIGFLKNSKVVEIVKGQEFLNKLVEYIKNNFDNNAGLKPSVNDFVKNIIKGFDNLPVQGKDELIAFVLRTVSNKVLNKVLGEEAINHKDNSQIIMKEDNQESNMRSAIEKLYVRLGGEEAKPDLNVKELYRDIYTRLETVRESIETFSPTIRNDIAVSIDYVQNSIKFLNDINSFNTYVQIPIDFGDRKGTGELYILKRGRKRSRINPEDATMLLSLDTENMGRVDSLIYIKKKNISLNLRVENQEVLAFLKDNYKKLYKMLLNKGYKLYDIKYKIIDSDINVINAEKSVHKELKSGISSVDLRI